MCMRMYTLTHSIKTIETFCSLSSPITNTRTTTSEYHPSPRPSPHLIGAAAGGEQCVDGGGCRPGQLHEQIQRRAAVVVDAVGVGAGPQQRHDTFLVAPGRRLEQRRREHGGRDLAAHSPPEQLRQTAAIAVADRLHDAATGNDVCLN